MLLQVKERLTLYRCNPAVYVFSKLFWVSLTDTEIYKIRIVFKEEAEPTATEMTASSEA
jgi:hypothetical protein